MFRGGVAAGKFEEALDLSPGAPLSAQPGAGWTDLRRRGIPRGGRGAPFIPGRGPASPGPAGSAAARALGGSVSEAQKLSTKSGDPPPERGARAGGDFGGRGASLVWPGQRSAAWGGCRPVAPGLGEGCLQIRVPGAAPQGNLAHGGRFSERGGARLRGSPEVAGSVTVGGCQRPAGAGLGLALHVRCPCAVRPAPGLVLSTASHFPSPSLWKFHKVRVGGGFFFFLFCR